MLNIILFDSDDRAHLQPLTTTRPMGELRLGILTLREKWERRLRGSASYITQDYLQEKYPIRIEAENLIVNSGVIPTEALCRRVDALQVSEALLVNGELVAARLNEEQFEHLLGDEEVHALHGIEVDAGLPISTFNRLWEMTRLNAAAIADDFALICSGRASQPIPGSNRVIGSSEHIFLEEGVKMECCILNTSEGPIYIGKNTEVMEGSMLRGPLSIGADSIVKMGAKIYGGTTIGPGCRIGGEVTRSILMANSNKAHDGYLGDSVIGEWCN
ncbi:MAG TPA: putative sugar nucleotidyl transferase, partial [Saprospiraceae bacterium]|nr:putative sugar nucleotidyl transferase [Saprospiraceae bacterium]